MAEGGANAACFLLFVEDGRGDYKALAIKNHSSDLHVARRCTKLGGRSRQCGTRMISTKLELRGGERWGRVGALAGVLGAGLVVKQHYIISKAATF